MLPLLLPLLLHMLHLHLLLLLLRRQLLRLLLHRLLLPLLRLLLLQLLQLLLLCRPQPLLRLLHSRVNASRLVTPRMRVDGRRDKSSRSRSRFDPPRVETASSASSTASAYRARIITPDERGKIVDATSPLLTSGLR